MSQIMIGVEDGQRRSHSAFCVRATFAESTDGASAIFVVRSLEPLGVGTTIPRLSDRFAEVEANALAKEVLDYEIEIVHAPL